MSRSREERLFTYSPFSFLYLLLSEMQWELPRMGQKLASGSMLMEEWALCCQPTSQTVPAHTPGAHRDCSTLSCAEGPNSFFRLAKASAVPKQLWAFDMVWKNPKLGKCPRASRQVKVQCLQASEIAPCRKTHRQSTASASKQHCFSSL